MGSYTNHAKISVNENFESSSLVTTTETFIGIISQSYWAYVCRYNIGRVIIAISILLPRLTTLGTLAFYCSSCFQHVSYSDFIFWKPNHIGINFDIEEGLFFMLGLSDSRSDWAPSPSNSNGWRNPSSKWFYPGILLAGAKWTISCFCKWLFQY